MTIHLSVLRSLFLPAVALPLGCLALFLGAACGGDDEDPATVGPTRAATTAAGGETKSPVPASSATSAASPAADPTLSLSALKALGDRLTKAYTDNRTFMPRASTDELQVSFDVATGLVVISIHPSPTSKNSIGPNSGFPGGFSSDALAITAQSAVVAGKSIWKDFPEVKRINVAVATEFDIQGGSKMTETAAGITVERATGEKMDFEALKISVPSNSNQFFCMADAYRLHVVVWNGITDKGCLTAQTKGTTR